MTVVHDGRPVQVDVGMAGLLSALWAAGVGTVYSCQGEPGRPGAENLAYLAFPTVADRIRFAARLPTDLPGWEWVIEHEVAGGRDSVHFPPADLSWLVELFGRGEGDLGPGRRQRSRRPS
ncbi:hypothetical protein MXD59_12765 [Frankia sp. Ag45/Mut15]|uniref:Uncharacterized protein n=1 Tax=Frankia umida TaxID=573489 RepID=A0ABT0JZC1_9ACTN|nr:hypothetical protein [Frankia umida]MCK9876639.1 hypothetical protein [Frankia umida]